MLDELLKEIEELKKYKKMYECALVDKHTMSDKLYDYMLKEYNTMSRDERINLHKNKTCTACRYKEGCNIQLPEDVWKPIKSEKAWIPAKTICCNFKWS